MEEALLELEVSWLPNLKPPAESLVPEAGVPNLKPPVEGKEEGAAAEEEEGGAPNLKPVVADSALVVPAVRKGEAPEGVEEGAVEVRMRPPPGPTAPGAGPALRAWGGTDPAHTQGACPQ